MTYETPTLVEVGAFCDLTRWQYYGRRWDHRRHRWYRRYHHGHSWGWY